MGGNDQHYIPRMLLRKFEAGSACRRKHVYSYHRKYPVRLRAIKGVASKVNFYSDDVRGSLDESITAYENRLSVIFERISCGADFQKVDVDDASEYVTHLIVRANHFREIMSNAMVSLVDMMVKEVCREGVLYSLLVNGDGSPKGALDAELSDLIRRKDVDLVPLSDDLLKRIAIEFIREKGAGWMAEISAQFENMFQGLEGKAAEAAEGAHKHALEMSLAPQVRIKGLQNLQWVVLERSLDEYILPDCVAICLRGDVGNPSPLLYEDIEFVNIVMTPISPRKLLVGYVEGVDLEICKNFNEFAAKCSESYFISAYESDVLLCMKNCIGDRSSGVINEYIVNAVHSAIESGANGVKPQECCSVRHSSIDEFEYILAIEGVSEKEREDIVNAVSDVVSEFSRVYDISSLGGIKFFTECEGRPSAYIVPEVNGEELKISIYAHADVAQGLLGEDSESRLASLYILVFLLARIAAKGKVCSMFPRFKTERIFGNLYDDILSSMYSAWEGYFSARISARLNPSLGGGYASSAREALANAAKDIYAARLQFHKTGDFEVFYSILFKNTSEFIEKISFYFGHLDGAKEFENTTGNLASLGLGEYGLYEWGELLKKDFSFISDNYGEWGSESVFRNLVVKMERAYWAFKVFIWEHNGSVRYCILQ